MSFDPPGRSEGYGACDDEQSAPREVFWGRSEFRPKMISVFIRACGRELCEAICEAIL